VTAIYKWSVVSGMADIPVPGYQSFWTNQRSTLKSEYHRSIGQFPDVDTQLKQLFKVLGDIEDVTGHTPASVGDSEQWSAITNSVENRRNFCKALSGKSLLSALYGTDTVALCSRRVPQEASLKHQRMATKKFGGERGIVLMRPPQLLRKQCRPQSLTPETPPPPPESGRHM
jgi:hypothetical protein